MENINYFSTNYVFSPKLRSLLTYFSVFLFISFAGFVTTSLKNYLNSTLLIHLVEPEPAYNDFVEEALQENFIAVTVQKGDTLQSLLARQHLSSQDIAQVSDIFAKYSDNLPLIAGRQVILNYESDFIDKDNEDLVATRRVLSQMVLPIDRNDSLELIKDQNHFAIKNPQIVLSKKIIKHSSAINSSVVSTLKSLGIPSNSIIELVNSYSHQVNFQRQIKLGDRIEVVIEKFSKENGDFAKYGQVLYASLILSGKKHNIYRYSLDGFSNHQFFSEDGKTMKKSLLKTPLSISQISSHYGFRKDPFCSEKKMHTGIDIAAREGTPINAAGDGIVSAIGWQSGYGNMIQIKHNSTLSTLYAHASKFPKNLKVGHIVKQGQVIAYVGRTGRASGSHLHYEVKVNGKHVNPLSIKSTPSIKLTGLHLDKFNKLKAQLESIDSETRSFAMAHNY